MDYKYDVIALEKILSKRLEEVTSPNEWLNLQDRKSRLHDKKNGQFFTLTFALMPRLIKKNIVYLDAGTIEEIQRIRPGFCPSGWQIDRIARSWWLLQLPSNNEAEYCHRMNLLFQSAEMNEQIALYGSLPLFAYPEAFIKRTTEGLRTSIRTVFEAIALVNPYPPDYLEEPAWNQLVLKSFFIGININQIIGLDKKANKTLAYILSDYAHERWAAGRQVNPLLWRLVGPFIDKRTLPDIQRLFQSGNEREKEAAALACSQSNFQSAKGLLGEYFELKKQIENNLISWEKLEPEV